MSATEIRIPTTRSTFKQRIDLTGQRFGRLLVIEQSGRGSRGQLRWRCVCDCGATLYPMTQSLRSGQESCGCLKWENLRKTARTHGMSGTPTYHSWRSMISRCCNPNDQAASDYYARGITVCDQWRRSFEAFLADMGECPPGLSIDRKDNARGYEPGNCRWATMVQQNRNRRSNHMVTCFGETKTVVEWSEDARCLVKQSTLAERLRIGWSMEDAITKAPVWRGQCAEVAHV